MSAAILYPSGYPATLSALLADLPVTIRLYTNDPDLATPLTPASFVQPVYTGYAPIGIVAWTPATLRAGIAFAVADPPQWVYTAGPLPLPIRGWYATAGLAGPLLWAWRRPGAAFQISELAPVLSFIITANLPAA